MRRMRRRYDFGLFRSALGWSLPRRKFRNPTQRARNFLFQTCRFWSNAAKRLPLLHDAGGARVAVVAVGVPRLYGLDAVAVAAGDGGGEHLCESDAAVDGEISRSVDAFLQNIGYAGGVTLGPGDAVG